TNPGGSSFLTSSTGFVGIGGTTTGSFTFLVGTANVQALVQTIGWGESVTSAALAPAPRTSNVAAGSLTIIDGAPFASATGSNRDNGGVLISVNAAVAGGTQKSFEVAVAGKSLMKADGSLVHLGTDGDGTNLQVRWNGKTQSAVGAAGSATALPAKPTGYI